MEDSDDDYQRRESETHRLDRHWNELLQELRVTQTAAQIIGGFLFTLPFQQRFASLDTWDKALYLGLVLLAAATTIITLLPVAVHRRVFRRHQRGSLVRLADRASKTVLVLLPLLVAGALTLTVDVVAGRTAATLCAVAAVGVLVILFVTVAFIGPRVHAVVEDVQKEGDREERR